MGTPLLRADVTPGSGRIPEGSGGLPSPVLMVLWLVIATAAVQFGMDVILLARKGEMRDFAAGYTAAVVERSGASFYDPQPGKLWFFENENPELIATARRLGTMHWHDDVEHVHVFSYPPAMMFVMLPFATVPFSIAKVGWLAGSLLAIGGGLWLVGRTIQSRSLAAFLVAFIAVTLREVQARGSCLALVPSADPAALRETLARLLTDAQARARLAAAAQTYAVRESIATAGARALRVYTFAMEQRR